MYWSTECSLFESCLLYHSWYCWDVGVFNKIYIYLKHLKLVLLVFSGKVKKKKVLYSILYMTKIECTALFITQEWNTPIGILSLNEQNINEINLYLAIILAHGKLSGSFHSFWFFINCINKKHFHSTILNTKTDFFSECENIIKREYFSEICKICNFQTSEVKKQLKTITKIKQYTYKLGCAVSGHDGHTVL